MKTSLNGIEVNFSFRLAVCSFRNLLVACRESIFVSFLIWQLHRLSAIHQSSWICNESVSYNCDVISIRMNNSRNLSIQTVSSLNNRGRCLINTLMITCSPHWTNELTFTRKLFLLKVIKQQNLIELILIWHSQRWMCPWEAFIDLNVPLSLV